LSWTARNPAKASFHEINHSKILLHNNISSDSELAVTVWRTARASSLALPFLNPTYFMTTQLVLETVQKFRLIIGAVRQHSRALEAACGIGGAQVWMLATIADAPDITVTQLGKALSVHVSTASNLLDKLARAGLVERLRGEEDRRVVRLRLTDRGRDIVARAPRPLSGRLVDALERMPEDSLARLDKELAEFIKQMNLLDQSAANEPLSNLVR
jgi:DNA-binding MarR family transcriptional regulator